MDQAEYYEHKLSFEIDAWDVSESLKSGGHLVVLDVRSSESFAQEHITGAMNLHHKIMTGETTGHLDKALLYVTYCDGVGCNASTKGALKLTQLGFKVKEMIGGLDWWKRDGHPTERASIVAGDRYGSTPG